MRGRMVASAGTTKNAAYESRSMVAAETENETFFFLPRQIDDAGGTRIAMSSRLMITGISWRVVTHHGGGIPKVPRGRHYCDLDIVTMEDSPFGVGFHVVLNLIEVLGKHTHIIVPRRREPITRSCVAPRDSVDTSDPMVAVSETCG